MEKNKNLKIDKKTFFDGKTVIESYKLGSHPLIDKEKNIHLAGYLKLLYSSDSDSDDLVAFKSKRELQKAIYNNSADYIVIQGALLHLIRNIKKLRKKGKKGIVIYNVNFYAAFFILIFFIKTLLSKKANLKVLTKNDIDMTYAFCILLEFKGEKIRKRARRYIPYNSAGNLGFFELLNRSNIRYVVLRWFDNAINQKIEEDIDLLIHDEDIERFEKILNINVGIYPCDCYSINGVPGYDYLGMAYYPPSIAKEIIENRVKYKSKINVPDEKRYFLSLCYHALFHKGYSSGLGQEIELDHNYTDILRKMALQLGVDINMTMEDVYLYLFERKWTPSLDQISRISLNNSWVKEQVLPRLNFTVNPLLKGLSVFVIREVMGLKEVQKYVLPEIENSGLSIIYWDGISEQYFEKGKEKVRGGNWGPGPWKVCGGNPKYIVVAMDFLPLSPSKKEKERYPLLESNRLLVKEKIREKYNSERVGFETNPIHSSDCSLEAVDYVNSFCPDKFELIQDRIRALREKYFSNDYKVIKKLSGNNKRAKVEVIEYKGAFSVKKTFLPTQLWYYKNEVKACEIFANQSFMPKVFEIGDNYLIYEYLERGRKLSECGLYINLKTMNLVCEKLKYILNMGYTLVDFHPGNVIQMPDGTIKIIDYEYLQKYDEIPRNISLAYEFNGVPENLKMVTPEKGATTFRKQWKTYVGVNIKDIESKKIIYMGLSRWVYFFLSKKFYKRVFNKAVNMYESKNQN